MTTPNIPEATDEQRRLARDWAESVESSPDTWTERLRVAARVILNDVPAPTPPTTAKENPGMADQTLDDQLRPIVAAMRAAMRRDEHTYSYGEFLGDMSDYIKDLEALLPDPPRPTLADMTPEERAACQWMQADVGGWREEGRWVVVEPCDTDGDVGAVFEGGEIEWLTPETVIPRPDLPRLEWPGDTPTGPDHLAVGTVIESADDPRLDALPLGSILLDRDGEAVTKRRLAWMGRGYVPRDGEGVEFGPWKVLHIPKENG